MAIYYLLFLIFKIVATAWWTALGLSIVGALLWTFGKRRWTRIVGGVCIGTAAMIFAAFLYLLL